MKITVKANDFCSDDCPAFEFEDILIGNDIRVKLPLSCAHAELCKAVYETVLKKKIEEAEKRG